MGSIRSIACFVSPHGFGHAARSSAVLGELHRLNPGIALHVFTRVPEWFFAESLSCSFAYHPLETDVGMVQLSPLHEDVAATVEKLDQFLEFTPERLDVIATQLHACGCELVICDIAPLGIAVARHAGLPSVLIENFTWDWIYQGYAQYDPRMAVHAARLSYLFARATRHVQTQPVCVPCDADLVTMPVSRPCRATAAQTRAALGIAPEERLVLVSMGGVHADYSFLDELGRHDHCVFMLPTRTVAKPERKGSLIMLPWHSSLYHPDMVAAANVVVGKLGYSTIAEVYTAGVAFGYFTRARFCESGPLHTYVNAHIPSIYLPEESYTTGKWVRLIEPLLDCTRVPRPGPNGATTVAEYLGSGI